MKWSGQHVGFDRWTNSGGDPPICYVCDTANQLDTDSCRYCSAPLALTYGAQSKQQRPNLVAVLGAPSSGKTVYLGMLTDILSRHHGAMQILAKGAFSVSLQQHTVSALSRKRFPPSTPAKPEGWNWVHCELSGMAKRRPVELVLPDVAGSTFMAEIEQTNSCPMIRSFLERCAAAIILVDTDRMSGGAQEPDLLAMKIVSYLLGLEVPAKRGWPNRPLAIVFNKADRSVSCSQDPVSYAETNAPGLWRLCQDRLKRHQYFAASVVGACAQVKTRYETISIPLRVAPRGVTEPFTWLVHQLPK